MPHSDGEIYSRLSFDSEEQRAAFIAAIKAAYIDGYEWGNIDDFPAGPEQAEKRWAGSDSNPENKRTPNAETQAAMREVREGRAERFETVEEVFDDLRNKEKPGG